MTKQKKDRIALWMMSIYFGSCILVLLSPIFQQVPSATLKEYKDYLMPFYISAVPSITIAAASFFFGREHIHTPPAPGSEETASAKNPKAGVPRAGERPGAPRAEG
jgi:hypothetical protein